MDVLLIGFTFIPFTVKLENVPMKVILCVEKCKDLMEAILLICRLLFYASTQVPRSQFNPLHAISSALANRCSRNTNEFKYSK